MCGPSGWSSHGYHYHRDFTSQKWRLRKGSVNDSRVVNNSQFARLISIIRQKSFFPVVMAVLLLVVLQEPVEGSLLLPLPGCFLASTNLPRKQQNCDISHSHRHSHKSIRFRTRLQQRGDSDKDSMSIVRPSTTPKRPTSEKDILIARAGKLRQLIYQQQNELVALEQRIACCYDNEDASPTNHFLIRTFRASSDVFWRKIDRVRKRVGPSNQQWEGRVGDYLFHELFAGLRIASRLATRGSGVGFQELVRDPRTPTLVPHAPAILARLDKLENHVRPIIESVLNDRQHLASIEPYLDEILERFDDIEPHLPWILDNIDALAPYTGLLLKHIDALLLYADADADIAANNGDAKTSSSSSYSLADQLLPYLEYYVSNLDIIGPHLVLLRPHVPLLLKHDRIAKVSPHINKLFARGYETRLVASANMDVLLFWFGWTLRIPFAPGLFFALPFSPALVSFLANRLPKKFARRGKSYCRNIECAVNDDYGQSWNKLNKI